ncbi:MAG: IS1634 family transposase [Gammaproteobacteria bacterium]|nr:IS1634 family transposase [Gammaproteobacteria bacterium]
MAIILEKKHLKGKCYWYATEKRRVNGKVKRIFQKYLGPEERCLAKLMGNIPLTAEDPEVFKWGAVTVLLHVAERIGVVELIDQYMLKQPDKDTRFYNPDNPHRPSLGIYILLAAVNRCIESTSKRDMYRWFSTTSLKRKWPYLTPRTISSQCFWDAMQVFRVKHLEELTKLIVDRVFCCYKDIDRSCLLFDQTNYYTFIDTFNKRNSIAQRGNNKQKRNNLRQIGYMMMVTKKHHIPIYYLCYQGNHNDITSFKSDLKTIVDTAGKSPGEAKTTLVFDKGNASKEVMTFLQEKLYFVTSLVPSDHKELLEECLKAGPMEQVREPAKYQEKILAYVTNKFIWEKTHTIVIGFSPSFFEKQKKSLFLQVEKTKLQLLEIQQSLNEYRINKKGKRRSLSNIRNRIEKLLKHDKLSNFIDYTLSGRKYIKLDFEVNNIKLERHIELYCGKTIHITNHADWSALDIIQAYRGQAVIEKAFKETKGMKHSLWQPMMHWTDQKIQVHAFYTFIALLLKSIVLKRLCDNGIDFSWNSVVTDLNTIYEVVCFDNIKCHITPQIRLSKMNDRQKELVRLLVN